MFYWDLKYHSFAVAHSYTSIRHYQKVKRPLGNATRGSDIEQASNFSLEK